VRSSLIFFASPGVGEAVRLLLLLDSGEMDLRVRFSVGAVADRKAEGDGLGPGRTNFFGEPKAPNDDGEAAAGEKP